MAVHDGAENVGVTTLEEGVVVLLGTRTTSEDDCTPILEGAWALDDMA